MSTTAPDKRITTHNPVVATTEFAAMFPVFDNDDIKVYVNGEERTNFAVSGVYVEGVSNNAKAVFAIGVTGKVEVVGERDPRRQNRFGPGPLPVRDMNLAFDTLQGEMQEARRDIERSVKSEFGRGGLALPQPVGDAYLGWDSAGAQLENKVMVSLGLMQVIDEDDMHSNSDTKVPTQQSVKAYTDRLVTIDDTSVYPIATLADNAFLNKRILTVKKAEVAALHCNPSAGDDLRDMCNWSAKQNLIDGSGDFYVEVADGLHDVSTYVDVYSRLKIKASAAPDFYQITGISFVFVSGNTYTATVSVATPLAARVITGFAIGCQNVKGDGGAHAINGAHIVKSVSLDRLSFTFDLLIYGVAPGAVTTLDNALTLNLTANQVVVAKACIRANSAGWDGAAREGFINSLDDGMTQIENLALAYNGGKTSHDMLFTRNGKMILRDRVVVAGAGSKVLRDSYGGNTFTNRCLFGGGLTADNIWQGVAFSQLMLVRSCFGSTISELISVTAASRAFGTACVMTGAPRGVRTTYADARAVFIGSSRLRHISQGIRADLGTIEVSASEDIQLCTDPLAIGGPGFIYGSPAISNNTNPVIKANFPIAGGGWYKNNAAVSAYLPRITATVDFPSIAAGGRADVPHPYPGVVFGMQIDVTATSAMASSNFEVNAFVSAADEITFRGFNYSASAIDPAAKTYFAQARATDVT